MPDGRAWGRMAASARRPAAIAAALLLAGCAAGPSADLLAREAAKSAVARTVEARFPGVPVQPVTDCIIDNASASEIGVVAIEAASGAPGPRTAQVVGEVVRRPATVQCLTAAALSAFPV